MLLDGNMTRWEAAIQELSEGYCKFVHMGDGILMRDLINTAYIIEHVRSHELDRLREAIVGEDAKDLEPDNKLPEPRVFR